MQLGTVTVKFPFAPFNGIHKSFALVSQVNTCTPQHTTDYFKEDSDGIFCNSILLWEIRDSCFVRVAGLQARIKPTALCSVFDKENSIEFPLDSVHYLYMKSNPNPSFYPMLPYESLSSCVSIDEKRKEKKRKTIIRN